MGSTPRCHSHLQNTVPIAVCLGDKRLVSYPVKPRSPMSRAWARARAQPQFGILSLRLRQLQESLHGERLLHPYWKHEIQKTKSLESNKPSLSQAIAQELMSTGLKMSEAYRACHLSWPGNGQTPTYILLPSSIHLFEGAKTNLMPTRLVQGLTPAELLTRIARAPEIRHKFQLACQQPSV